MSYSYYDKQSAKVAIMSVLVEKGWKIYGYKADESDMMTDYWSPADWEGIATKNGFVLVVDQYNTSYSGYEVRKYNYKVKGTSSDNLKKIEKLQATLNDAAATPNEKEVCKRKIEALENKEPNHPTYTVKETYPTFSHANPKSCTWHIEKDGEIIAKGKGLTTVYDCNNRELTKQNAEKFVAKIEKHIADDTQLEKIIKKTVKKVIKPVEVVDRQTIQKGDVLSFEYHGHFWIVLDVYTRKDGKTCATYELLGSEKRGYQRLTNGKRYYDYMDKLENNVQNGRVKIHTLQEVEEITEKIEYKKTKRKVKAQEDNLLSTEAVEEVATTQEATQEENTTIETPQTENNTTESTPDTSEITYQTGTGSKGNGIEITFTSKPSEDIRNAMKAVGFRWGGKKRSSIWWAIETEETLQLAKMLVGETSENDNNTDQNETPEQKEYTFTYPEIEINDIESYVVSDTLSKRENDANWIFRKSERNHTQEIQEYFTQLNNEVIELINKTDNQQIIYKLKKTLQYYKKHYFTNYIKRLENRASSPSWAVTGAAGRNRSRDEKMNNRYDKLMSESIYLDKDYKKRISQLESAIRKDKEQRIKNEVNNTSIEVDFTTQTKEFTYMNIKEKKRVYIHGDYWTCKLWACFRIFKGNKEIHSLKTTEKLDDAKKYISYLVAQDQRQKAV